MSDKRAMTLSLSEREMMLLEKLASDKSMSKTAVIKQAIGLYASMSSRIMQGEKVYMENPVTKDKAELMVL